MRKVLIFIGLALLLVISVHAETFDFGGSEPIDDGVGITPITDVFADEIKADTGYSFQYYDSNSKVLSFSQKIEVNGEELRDVSIENVQDKTFLQKQYKITSKYLGYADKDNIIAQTWDAPAEIKQVDENSFGYCQSEPIDLFFTTYMRTTCTKIDYSAEKENYDITFQAVSDRTITAYLRPKDQSSLIDKDGFLVLDPVITTFTTPTPLSGIYLNRNWFEVNMTTNITETNYAFVDFNNSLKLWMHLDNSTGENGTYFKDFSTYSNNGTCSGTSCPTLTQLGRFGGAYDFDGVSDFVNISGTNFNLSNTFTIGAWFYAKATGYSSGSDIIQKQFGVGVPYASWSISLYDTNKIVFGLGTVEGNLDVTTMQTTSAVTLNTWHHAVATFNGSTANLYIDGVLNKTNSTYNRNIRYSNDIVTLGSYTYGLSTNTFNGTIDEPMIFSRVLSAGEVASLYNASATQYYNNFTGLSDAPYTYTGYSVNLSGATSSTTQNITIDTTAPVINVITPQTPYFSPTRNIFINYTTTDANGVYLVNDWRTNTNTPSIKTWLRFENDNATNYIDSSNNLNWTSLVNATTNQAPTSVSNGRFGKAMQFNGQGGNSLTYLNGSYGCLYTANTYNLTRDFTVSMWYKAGGQASTDYEIIGRGAGSSNSVIELSRNGFGSITFRLNNVTPALMTSTLTEANILQQNVWKHLVITYNGSTANTYVNGILKANVSFSGNLYQNNFKWSVGAVSSSSGANTIIPCNTYFDNSTMDEIIIDSRAWSPTEINASYSANILGYSNNFTTTSDGAWYWSPTAIDQAGNVATLGTLNVTVDTVFPSINFTSPTTNGLYVSRSFILVNVTSTDVNLANITINLYNGSRTLLRSNTTTTSPNNINYSSMADGLYFFNATATDIVNQKNYTTTYNITLDTTFPLISFTPPTPNNAKDQYGDYIIPINVTITEANFKNITYTLSSVTLGTINTTTFTTLVTNLTFITTSYDAYTYSVRITDLANNQNTTTRSIYIQPPYVGIPSTGGSSSSPSINCATDEEVAYNLDGSWYCRKKEIILENITIQELAKLDNLQEILNSVKQAPVSLWNKLTADKCLPLTNFNPTATNPCAKLGWWLCLLIFPLVGLYYLLKWLILKRISNSNTRHQVTIFMGVILIGLFILTGYIISAWV